MNSVIHEFRNNYKGQERWAQVYAYADGYNVMCYIDNVYQNTVAIRGHSECYAEDCAENFVLGVHNGLQQRSS